MNFKRNHSKAYDFYSNKKTGWLFNDLRSVQTLNTSKYQIFEIPPSRVEN